MDEHEREVNEALGLMRYYIVRLYLNHPYWEESMKHYTASVRASSQDEANELATIEALKRYTAVSKRQISVKSCRESFYQI